VTCAHVFADLSGIPAHRLDDARDLGALLLAAANAAGLHPTAPPLLETSPEGTSAVLVCRGGHVALHAVPQTGVCFADLAAISAAHPQRGLDVIIRRLAAQTVRTDARQRGGSATAAHPERA
jgi:S-adenosylmethionine/arginine decarboxylase-like enzyme